MKYIPLTQGYVAVVSDKDYARCMHVIIGLIELAAYIL